MNKNWSKEDFLFYYKQGLNDREISLKVGISDKVINTYRNSLKLPSNVVGRSIDLTSIEKSVIVGTLLGDGFINAKSPLAGYLILGHSIKQEAWLLQKMEWLSRLFKRKPYYIKQVRKGTENTGIFCYSLSFRELKTLQSIFYIDNKKIIPSNIDEYFDELSLAVLYMDDGYCHKTHKGKYSTYYLSLCNFDNNSILNFIALLNKKWNIIATHQKSNNVIAISSKSKESFLKIIRPYIIDSMKYKISESL